MGIRRGDQVVVISGKDKGKKGKVLSVDENRITVEGVNIVVRNKKARSAKEKSMQEKKPGTIDISNVMILCKCGKPTRIAHKENNGKKNRVCVKCGEVLDRKFVKVKEKAKDIGEEVTEKDKEKAAAEKKPLVRREVKHTAESKIKKPQATTKATTTHRQIGGS